MTWAELDSNNAAAYIRHSDEVQVELQCRFVVLVDFPLTLRLLLGLNSPQQIAYGVGALAWSKNSKVDAHPSQPYRHFRANPFR